MAQYIDKSALVAEIEKRAIEAGLHDGVIAETREDECYSILSLINTIEVKDVDLDTEIMKYQREIYDRDTTVRDVAKHFFELGLSVSNSTKVTIPDIDDVLKENGVNPDSKEAKIIKESYFMAIEKLAQKGE